MKGSVSSLTDRFTQYYRHNYSPAFTLVELLVVIVIIGILAAISIVAYVGITGRANTASMQSDLESNSKVLKLYYASNGVYPITLNNNCPDTPIADTGRCLKTSPNNSVSYTPSDTTNPQGYRLTINSNGVYFSTNANGIICPQNFIVVPGSATYGTSDFCVMKYDASQSSATVPVSKSSATPWVNISQTNAITYSANVVDFGGSTCTTCHLLTEPEYMTLAQNVLSVPSNWSSGTVGTGYIYSGHTDNSPSNTLAADPDDTNSYAGTGNTSPSNQRRTLTLTNGEVIWDLTGNVYIWTNATIGPNLQPGLAADASFTTKDWNNASLIQNGFTSTSMPVSTGITGISTWNYTKGIGRLVSNYTSGVTDAYRRSGHYNSTATATGVLSVNLSSTPATTSATIGFRVAK